MTPFSAHGIEGHMSVKSLQLNVNAVADNDIIREMFSPSWPGINVYYLATYFDNCISLRIDKNYYFL